MDLVLRVFCTRESMYRLQVPPLPLGPVPSPEPDPATVQQHKHTHNHHATANNSPPAHDDGKDNNPTQEVELAVKSTEESRDTLDDQQPRFTYTMRRQRPTETPEVASSTMRELPARAYIPPHCRKTKQNEAGGEVRELPKSAYIPPHLRVRKLVAAKPETPLTTIDSAKPETPLATIDSAKPETPAATIDSAKPETPVATIDSAKSKAPAVDKLDSSPNHVGHDEARQDPPPTKQKAPKRKKHRRRRTRKPKGSQQRPKHVWPKKRDMKPSSNPEADVVVESNSFNDADYDLRRLTDWRGKWIEPPEDWADRTGFRSRDFGDVMEQWMNGHSKCCLDPMDTWTPDFVGNGCREIVPRYWTLSTVEEKPIGEFWEDMPNRAPAPVSDIDIKADEPFWERYENDSSCFIKTLAAPEARIDPKDPEYAEHGPEKLACTDLRLVQLQRDKEEGRDQKPERQEHSEDTPSNIAPVVAANKFIKPDSNIYVRPVQPIDVHGVAVIYNWHIANTIHAKEFQTCSLDEIGRRIDAITREGLPFLVAVAKGVPPAGAPRGVVCERIAGYICLSEYAKNTTMYRHTFNAEVYVDPAFRSHKVGQYLIDKLLRLVSPGYVSRGGYEYRNDFEYLKSGFHRVVKTIKIALHVEHDGMDTKLDDYLRAFDFYSVGHIQNIGYKLGRVVDLYLYQHLTNQDIDPYDAPAPPLGLALANH